MGASISRLQRAGGNTQAALQGLQDEYAAGAQGWSPAQKAAYANPATRDAWANQQIGQTTKGKYSGVLGKAVQLVSKAAPLAALIPGVGIPLAAGIGAAGRLAGGGGVKGALIGGLEGGAGAALLGGKGFGALNKAKSLIGATPGAATTATTPGSGGILSNLISGITKDPLKAAQYGLAGYSALQGAKAQSRGNAALGTALGSLGTGEPLQREDLSGVYDQQNPYAVPTRPNSALAAARRSLGGR